MKLTKEQALYCAQYMEDYYHHFDRIDDYMRSQKKTQILELPSHLPGMGPEEDLFSDFTIHPNDMEFEIINLGSTRWWDYITIISSHLISRAVPGRCIQFAIFEKNTKKIVGFIRLGSPVINCRPRNELLGQVFTQSKESAFNFNNTTAMGFTIVPSQPFGYNYLGGKLLAALCCSHEIRELINEKYKMNLCLFETTSLYGSSKAISQYDGMKPYLRFKGLTDSNFVPMLDGDAYKKLKDYVEAATGEQLIDPTDSSKKLKATLKVISLVKVALKGEPELVRFNEVIDKAKGLTERKRYYISNYGFKNYIEVVNGKETKLIPDPENYEKFHMKNIVEWWKKKATNRYETLKSEGRLRNDIEVWTGDKEIDIIR
jgi:hypothetical protein